MAIIDKPSDYFNTKLYTGTGSSNAITGVGFQPDFTWIKTRGVAESHVLFDAVRTNGYYLKSDATSAEINGSSSGTNLWTSFDSDGFTVDSNGARTNTNTYTYASWNWKAGGTASSNTDGSITSNVSANTTSGFSIVSYTGNATAGATIGHGLGVVPKVIFYKNRDQVVDWSVYTEMVGNDKKLTLNLTTASSVSAHYNSTTPTSSFFTVGSSDRTNGSGDSMIAYCFAEKQGFSKFGSYTGNGSTDGTFVYTGFKPAFLLIKQTGATGKWLMIDNKRDPDNACNHRLNADVSNAESTGVIFVDMLSNGWKLRTTSTDYNTSGVAGIYMAFAENPFVSSTGVPATAR